MGFFSSRRAPLLFLLLALAASARADDRAIAENHYRLGLSYEQSGLAHRALEEYDEARRIAPDFLDAQIRAGTLLIAEGRLPEALATIQKALSLAPERNDLRGAIAAIFERMGKREDAMRIYEASLARDPAQPGVALRLGTIYLEYQRYTETRRVLERPDLLGETRALLLRAYSHAAMGENADARTLYKQALAIDPNQGSAWYNLGLLYAKDVATPENAEESLRAFRNAEARLPDPTLAYLSEAEILERLGRMSEAVRALEGALSRRPGDAALRLRLGKALYATGNLGGAVRQFESVREANPSLAELYPLLGRSYLRLGRTEEARRELLRALALLREDSGLLEDLARAEVALLRYADALPHFERLVTLRPTEASLRRDLARLYAEAGNAKRAVEVLEVAHEIELRERMEAIRLENERMEAARRDAERREIERRESAAASLASAQADRLRGELEAERARIAEAELTIARLRDDLARAASAAAAGGTAAAGGPAEVPEEAPQVAPIAPAQPDRIVLPPSFSQDSTVKNLREELFQAVIERDSALATLAALRAAEPGTAQSAEIYRETLNRLSAERDAALAELRDLRGALDASQAGMRDLRGVLDASQAGMRDTALEYRAQIQDLRNELARLQGASEADRAEAERTRAEAQFEVRSAQAQVSELARLVAASIQTDLGRSVEENRPPADLLNEYLEAARRARAAEISRILEEETAKREGALRDATSRLDEAIRAARSESDRAIRSAQEELRHARNEIDSSIATQVERERDRLRAEALSRRLAAIEEVRAGLEAEYAVKESSLRAELEAQFQEERRSYMRRGEEELRAYQTDATRRLEAGRMEIERLNNEITGLTAGETTLLERSQVYRQLLGENQILRAGLEEKIERLNEVSAERQNLRKDLENLRREYDEIRSRMEGLSAEVARVSAVGPITELLAQRININAASLDELMLLPGIGITEARNIVWWRENQGAFARAADLSRVPGISPTLAERLAPLLRIR